MKFYYALLFTIHFFGCRPDEPLSVPNISLTGERAGDFTILTAKDFYVEPQVWHIDDQNADIFFVFEPSKKTIEVKTIQFEFTDFNKCQIWLGPYSKEMATAETSLDLHFPILPPPAPFLAQCEKDGLQFLAAPTQMAADRLVFHLSEDFWEAWEAGCLDWPWSIYFQFYVKG